MRPDGGGAGYDRLELAAREPSASAGVERDSTSASTTTTSASVYVVAPAVDTGVATLRDAVCAPPSTRRAFAGACALCCALVLAFVPLWALRVQPALNDVQRLVSTTCTVVANCTTPCTVRYVVDAARTAATTRYANFTDAFGPDPHGTAYVADQQLSCLYDPDGDPSAIAFRRFLPTDRLAIAVGFPAAVCAVAGLMTCAALSRLRRVRNGCNAAFDADCCA